MVRNPASPFRWRWAWAAALIVLFPVQPAGAETVRVEIAASAFAPATATVALTAGEPAAPAAHAHVIWTMQDPGTEHTVTFDDVRVVSSGRLATGQTHEVVFALAGTYPYRCTIHPGMAGSVVVIPAPAPPPTSAAASAPSGSGEDEGSGGGPAPGLVGVAAVAALSAVAWFLLRRRRAVTP